MSGTSDRQEAKTEAHAMLATAPMFLDTETTGLGPDAEIVEIGILDAQGEIMFESLIRPKAKIPKAASKIHGITNEAVSHAPAWPEVHNQVCSILKNQNLVIYNAAYDNRLLEQTAGVYGLTLPGYRFYCAMLGYAQFHGEWNKSRRNFRWQKLTVAAKQMGVQLPNQGQAHRAIYDCRLTLEVIRAMVNS